MDVQEVLAESMRREANRIRFLERTRGEAEARLFARRTCSGYRRAVLGRSAPAGETVYRLRLMGSYCYLKRYLSVVSHE